MDRIPKPNRCFIARCKANRKGSKSAHGRDTGTGREMSHRLRLGDEKESPSAIHAIRAHPGSLIVNVADGSQSINY
jgi:hypothetical protein